MLRYAEIVARKYCLMDALALWQHYQDWLYYHPELEFYVDVSRMGLTPEVVRRLEPAFERAFQQMKELEAGAIANPDEGRMVGHYWLRDADLAPTPELRAEIRDAIAQVKQFSQQVHSGAIAPPQGGRFTDILSVGIGGSALGPQFVAAALAPVNPP